MFLSGFFVFYFVSCFLIISKFKSTIFFLRYKRGGVCCVNRRHSHVNHETAPEYDPQQPVKVIFYDDANNLYGRAMVSPLPHKNIRFCNPVEEAAIAEEFLTYQGRNLDDEGNVGFILEVLSNEKKEKGKKRKKKRKKATLSPFFFVFYLAGDPKIS